MQLEWLRPTNVNRNFCCLQGTGMLLGAYENLLDVLMSLGIKQYVEGKYVTVFEEIWPSQRDPHPLKDLVRRKRENRVGGKGGREREEGGSSE